jgi:bifunctional UDP-N-acetylglucosamine pyrophosphorylase/glucosamine-1-phosphate N-acetyltransferase
MPDLHIIVLAAGKGTRMKSARPKVLHHVAGTPMVEWVLRTAMALRPRTMTIVVGHQATELKAALSELSGQSGPSGFSGLSEHRAPTFVVQEPQLGTAHALLAAEPALGTRTGILVMLYADVPMLTVETVARLMERHTSSGAAATVLTADVENPHGYGRIVRDGEQIARIVEERDASSAERQIREINSGIYAFTLEGLFEAVHRIAPENAQGEYYLPDLVAIFRRQGRKVETLKVPDADEIRGINSRAELAEVSRIVRQRKNAELMAGGVTIEDPATTFIDRDVAVGADSIIHPGVSLEGTTSVGQGCEIHSGVRIVNSRVGDRVLIKDHCLITDSTIGNDASVGPFAHFRPGVELRDGAHVGNFVELKKTVLGPGSKAMHLAYLGDATIGAKVNIGAGTITCNYDGVTKNPTIIEDGAFIGSDSQLVAPVTIGKGAYVGSGTTVREDVPAGSLAVSAGKQRNIDGWVDKKKKGKGTRD